MKRNTNSNTLSETLYAQVRGNKQLRRTGMPPKRVWNDENIDPESGGTLKDVQGRRVQQRSSLRNLNQNLERHLNANGNDSRGSSPSKSVLEELDALSQDNCSSSEDDSHAVGEGHNEQDCQQQEGGPHFSGDVQVDGMSPCRDIPGDTSHHLNNGNMQQGGRNNTANMQVGGRPPSTGGSVQLLVGGRPPFGDRPIQTARDQNRTQAPLNHWTNTQSDNHVRQNGRLPPSRGNDFNDDLLVSRQQQPPMNQEMHQRHQVQNQQESIWEHHKGVGQDIRYRAGDRTLLHEAGRRAMSYRAAKAMQQKHVADRIQIVVKTKVFRKCKFITSGEHFDKVMQVVVDSEKPADASKFVRIYKTCVVGSLNTKRSTCEQAAAEAVMKLLKIKNHVDEVEPPPYSMDILCKLRQSQSDLEREAFLWFAGELVECVSGKRAWGARTKYKAMISEATSNDTRELIVTVSDEAPQGSKGRREVKTDCWKVHKK